jgi:hypothetical protein
MAPPGAIVVPKMVVGVAGTATNGQFRMLIHLCVFPVGAHAPGGLDTKRPSIIATASRIPGRTVSGTNSVPRICRSHSRRQSTLASPARLLDLGSSPKAAPDAHTQLNKELKLWPDYSRHPQKVNTSCVS